MKKKMKITPIKKRIYTPVAKQLAAKITKAQIDLNKGINVEDNQKLIQEITDEILSEYDVEMLYLVDSFITIPSGGQNQ